MSTAVTAETCRTDDASAAASPPTAPTTSTTDLPSPPFTVEMIAMREALLTSTNAMVAMTKALEGLKEELARVVNDTFSLREDLTKVATAAKAVASGNNNSDRESETAAPIDNADEGRTHTATTTINSAPIDATKVLDDFANALASARLDQSREKAESIASIILLTGVGPCRGVNLRGSYTCVDHIMLTEGLMKAVSPLHIASYWGRADVVDILLTAGADVHATTANGGTPLHWAANRKHSEAAKVLLCHGAATEVTDDAGFTPLFLCSRVSENAVMAELLDAGALTQVTAAVDVTTAGVVEHQTHWTALHVCAYSGCLESVSLLLANGADPLARNGSLQTPQEVTIDSAASWGGRKCRELLARYEEALLQQSGLRGTNSNPNATPNTVAAAALSSTAAASNAPTGATGRGLATGRGSGGRGQRRYYWRRRGAAAVE